ncbi:MAG: hypothetical protein QOG01_3560 [Pseudonocardiales bacterium]|nr:hypothetical protein [Pseudonocardiales bacterium]
MQLLGANRYGVADGARNRRYGTGNQFRYDSTSQQYIFNWSTKGLTAGTYLLKIDLSYGAEYTVIVSLK